MTDRDHLLIKKVRYPFMYPRIGIAHGPGLIRKDESSWRTWNGIFFRAGHRIVWLQIRKG